MNRAPGWLATTAAALLLLAPHPAAAQTADAALKDRVGQLIERLDAPKIEARDAAEEALVKLGPRVLPLLPDAAKVTGAERKQRLERVREKLREAFDETNTGASKVTIKAKGMRLSEVVQKLQAQTGNVITDLRDDDSGNPSLDVDIDDKPFLEALDMVCRLAEISPSFFTGDGTVGLVPGKLPEGSPIVYNGPFRILFKQLATINDLQAKTAVSDAVFEVAWEPRLRPMLLKLKADEIKVVDDQGRTIEPEVDQESTEVVLRPENPVAEVNLKLKAPERSAKAIKSLKVKAETTVPAALKTFRFKSLAVKQPETIKVDDIAVTLEGTEVDEQVWKVEVVVAYPMGGPAFESYRQGLFNNRLWLQKPDGARFEHNGGFSNTSSDEGKLGFEYLFVDAPGKPSEFGLVYETPSKVIPIPLEFEFKDVELK